ncbi:MAG: FAD-binding oxidoreductase [Hyphomicrobium sp.]|jgi:ferredoxin-NADP reductase
MSETAVQGRLDAHLWDALPSKWNPDRDEILVCCHVRQETHDVKSFLFRTRTPQLFRYRPGQFITLELTIDGQQVNRCYTLSSPPTRLDTVSITVKRVPGGKASNWLHDNLKPGVEIKVLGPAGDFTCANHPAAGYLFLSGGSGITPLMSMVRTHYDLGEDKDIVFVHSARTPRDIIFRRELAMMAHGTTRFRTAFVCESTGEERDWGAPTGYLSLQILSSIAADFNEREIFCCGPEAYMAAVRNLLKGAGYNMARYHEESFSFERQGIPLPGAIPEPAVVGVVAQGFKIEYTLSGRVIDCGPDQDILEAARAAGMRLPFSCAKGLCGTCKTKKLSGEVVMKHGGGIRQREIDQGMILPCCSKPLSNVTLEK